MKEHIQQISGKDIQGNYILALIVKRSYTISDNGNCSLAEEQIPISQDVEIHHEIPEIIIQDSDLYPYKPLTDIIVKGKARNSTRKNSFDVSIEISDIKHEIKVFGDRKVFEKDGIWMFSEADPIEEIPLEYQYAYGGKDLLAEKPLREQLENEPSAKYVLQEGLLEGSPYRYPRNPAGKGYVVEPNSETMEGLELPNIEDPNNLLTPQNIVVNQVFDWYKMPVPVGTDWLSPGWFPRVAYYGAYPLPEGLDKQIYEIKKEWADMDILKSSITEHNRQLSFRATNGASLGMQSNFVSGGEACRLLNIHPKKREFILTLPNEKPTIKVDGRNGKMLKTKSKLSSVIIELDENRVTMVWSGYAKAIRPYMEEELKTMPYEVQW